MTDQAANDPTVVDLRGQTALVTGASSGIGAHVAELLARHGATVAVSARRVERLEELAERIRSTGGRAVVAPMDVTETATFPQILDDIEAEAGAPVSILINNAGIPDASFATKMSPELIDAVIDTNLKGPWVLAVEVARRLIDAELPGRIVNISSVAAIHYAGGAAALYSTTKAAVNRMTETLAVEWSRYHINVNAVAPGAISSEMMDGMLSRMGDITKAFPRRRLGTPADLDSTFLFLVSPASAFITGTVIVADDGQSPR